MATATTAGATGARSERVRLDVEVWSDVVCPWCYIGKRRFERALDEVGDELDVRVVFRPYQLDPTASPGTSGPVVEAYARKFGGEERAHEIIAHVTNVAAGEGLGFRMDRALRANTLLAHRLLWLAEHTGHQERLKERLLQAYFVDGLDIGDPDVLADCAAEIGMERDGTRQFLDSDDGLAEVRALMAHAVDNDITGVPAYVIADPQGRAAWMVPGAQDTETFVSVMRRIADKISAAGAAAGTDVDG